MCKIIFVAKSLIFCLFLLCLPTVVCAKDKHQSSKDTIQKQKFKTTPADSIILSPDPVTTMLFIETKGIQINHIEITSMKVDRPLFIREVITSYTEFHLPMENFPPGIYFIKFQTNMGQVEKEFEKAL